MKDTETNGRMLFWMQVFSVTAALTGNLLIACKHEPLAAAGFSCFLLATFSNIWVYYRTRLLVMMTANFLFMLFNVIGIWNNLSCYLAR